MRDFPECDIRHHNSGDNSGASRLVLESIRRLQALYDELDLLVREARKVPRHKA